MLDACPTTTSLIIDAKQFLHCGGRIHNALLSKLTKLPYLLLAKHLYLNLLSRIYTEISTTLAPMLHSLLYVKPFGSLLLKNT